MSKEKEQRESFTRAVKKEGFLSEAPVLSHVEQCDE
jgi:hypothetical protein